MTVMKRSLSDNVRHFFHVVSNVRPIVWICLYVALTPVFALIYWWLPDAQFRIPDGAGTDYGSWLYYSIVTITTLGFGDYTPAHGWAQAVTAVEVMCGLVLLGFFLNAVGAMKSEIDIETEIDKQRRLHYAAEKDKLLKSIPALIHNLNMFMAYCYAVTTREERRANGSGVFDPDFRMSDMADLFKPSGLPSDVSSMPAVNRFLACTRRTSLALDSLQSRVDLTLWPQLLEDCFSFVANSQLFSSEEVLAASGGDPDGALAGKIAASQGKPEENKGDMMPVFELYAFIKENGVKARAIETLLTEISTSKDPLPTQP